MPEPASPRPLIDSIVAPAIAVYARIRHPVYAVAWLWALSQPLLLHNWIAGVLSIPAFAALYILRTPQEESMMRDHFGNVWDNYAARTGRLLPTMRQ